MTQSTIHARQPQHMTPEDDGRSLLAKDQYRFMVQEIQRFDILQERTLAQMALEGNQEARTMLLENCLGPVYRYALRISHLHPSNSDVLDLCQVGCEAMIRSFDSALQSRYPCGFLIVIAQRKMLVYCIEDKLIRVPRTSYQSGKRAPLTVSLTAGRYGEEEETLLEMLEDGDWQSCSLG